MNIHQIKIKARFILVRFRKFEMAGSVSRLFNRTLVKIAEPHINQTVARITGNPPARNKTTGNSYADFEPRRQMLQNVLKRRDVLALLRAGLI